MKFAIFILFLIYAFTSPVSNAETYNFRVVYAGVPGVNEAVAGDIVAAIEILENWIKASNRYKLTDELATLCGLYVVQGKLVEAHPICDNAVKTDQSYTAYNNRGVLRVHLRNLTGAIEDFERARVLPHEQKHYIEEFIRRDVRIIATSNYTVAKRLMDNRKNSWDKLNDSVKGANVENIGN